MSSEWAWLYTQSAQIQHGIHNSDCKIITYRGYKQSYIKVDCWNYANSSNYTKQQVHMVVENYKIDNQHKELIYGLYASWLLETWRWQVGKAMNAIVGQRVSYHT